MSTPTVARQRPATGSLWGPRVLGAALLAAMGWIHLDLWLLQWVAVLGALTALGTLAGLLLATTVGLFGFVESTAADLWWESFWVEIAAVVVLGALAALAARRRD